MELCKLTLKNFGNVFLLTLLVLLIKIFIFLPKMRTSEVVEEMRSFMEAAPSKSIRKLSQQIHLFYGTGHTILKRP
ncbi:hypothetical protein BDFB_012298 [Asbolus verrucosus]|uniref:Uncharacterized protein n=1 Tax=Asbolus verrucosus TaxID=1661398 RepID=A0A482VWI5_ASBVE|nr:hypothetical protein BDFB_012298 [Asbolus verrucosus]